MQGGLALATLRTVCHAIRESEVGNFDVVAIVEEEIFRFEISVNHHVSMKIIHPADNLGAVKKSRLRIRIISVGKEEGREK